MRADAGLIITVNSEEPNKQNPYPPENLPFVLNSHSNPDFICFVFVLQHMGVVS